MKYIDMSSQELPRDAGDFPNIVNAVEVLFAGSVARESQPYQITTQNGNLLERTYAG